MLKIRRWINAIVSSVLLIALLTDTKLVHAEETTITEESIYDLLVDRYFNGSIENDFNANPNDITQFAGGDFKGLEDKLSLITDMKFSIASIGSVFATEKYDGSLVTSYEKIEPHFGTATEFTQLIHTFTKNNVKVMVDFPLSKVSVNHEWAKDTTKSQWILSNNNVEIQWDLENKEVQDALLDAIMKFVSSYDVGGIRLTNIENADSSFLNHLISKIKEENQNIYVISNQESDANFDAFYSKEMNKELRNAFQGVDKDTSNLLNQVELYLQGKQAPVQLMIDSILTDRFTFSTESYPPTRVKLAIASSLLFPGVPVIQYGTEIVMNGQAGAKAHQLYNFKTDSEIVEFIDTIQTLKKQSETLTNGEFNLIKNENGFLVFERFTESERWIIAINNMSKTARVDLSEEDIGYDKELRGMLNNDIIRRNEDGIYPVILNREVVEIFQVTEKKGINVSYIVALGLVYLLFIGFIIAIIKRGKKRRVDGE